MGQISCSEPAAPLPIALTLHSAMFAVHRLFVGADHTLQRCRVMVGEREKQPGGEVLDARVSGESGNVCVWWVLSNQEL